MLKTPISILQELIIQKKIAAPDYQVNGTGEPHCMSFTCHVKAGNQTALGAGVTKKEAKQDAAKNLLKIFGVNLDNQSQVSNLCMLPSKTTKLDVPTINYIGQLNEFSAGRKQLAPTYTDSAKGFGFNKKDAKQDSAKNMLALIKESNFEKIPIEPAPENKLTVNNELSEQVLKKYTDLIKNVNIAENGNCYNNNIETVNKEINISTWDELIAFLDKLNYRHELTTFQHFPLILSLKINDHALMDSGSTKEEILNKLVLNAVKMIKEGVDFSKPLIDL